VAPELFSTAILASLVVVVVVVVVAVPAVEVVEHTPSSAAAYSDPEPAEVVPYGPVVDIPVAAAY
jgi:hypothetical protein